jgi:MerR family transcriptional regulator, copper efflux regulator
MLIGQIAERTGVTKDAVRHYVEIGLLKPTPKRAGTRLYQDFCERDVERLKWIVLGKSLGFSLSEIDHYLKMFMDEKLSRADAARMFREKLTEVEEKIAQLLAIRDRLSEKLRTNYS